MSDHYKELDGLRGFAAQVVLVAHANALVLSDPSPLSGWLARLAVVFFFVLSGFAIATTIRRHVLADRRWDALDYAIRRIARIYPPYIVAVVFVGIISAFSLNGWDMLGMYGPAADFNTDAVSWFRTLLFLYTGSDAITVVDIAIWSLRIEVALYIMAGLVAAAWFARGVRLVLLIACLVALAGVFYFRLSFMVPAVILFAFGSAASFMLAALPKISPRLGAIAIVFILSLPLVLPNLTDDSVTSLAYQAALGAPIALSLVLLARAQLAHRSWLSRFVVASGSWSYTLYILHSPILIGLRTLFADNDPMAGNPMRVISMFILYFLITNLICWIIALAFERPSNYARLIYSCLAKFVPVRRQELQQASLRMLESKDH
jgi:peptidoglycan/LPS O-acetylase OafA/YrhL